MPTASIVVPAYNATRTLPETLRSLLCQTYRDFEIIVVDDGSTDQTAQIAEQFANDPRLRIVRQTNRGLAGARNSGIAAARGAYVGFCDADDLWVPHKLDVHIRHLDANPDVALSYSGSKLIDEDGAPLGIVQKPRRRGVTPAHVFKRNPIGNGSAVVARRVALTDIAYRPHFETERDWIFDETFRQSEDIECWLRMMLTTDWQIEGVAQLLTEYRISSHGLSASIDQQLDAWERMVTKLTDLNPEFFDTHADAARAYQYRYLARRAISLNLARRGHDFAWQSLLMSSKPLIEEPIKTLSTLAAAEVLKRTGALRIRQAMAALTAIKRF
ncbi:glycosyltransferase family A protein [uncultured Pelagimonas sp.]|uniref:glycosyltransferase family 2 protein n=1 Tax=uncultured Pelagimonas sp. TaxID=1618102 RepID=UPI00262E0297|nr:glycosyltransferase family A protein [uncultured Pelagimonas sp.]